MWTKNPKQLECSSRTAIPRIAMRYDVCNGACYQAYKKESNDLNMHSMFHFQGVVHMTASTKSFRPPSSVKHSRIQWRKKGQCGSFPKRHTHSEVNFGWLDQIKWQSTSHILLAITISPATMRDSLLSDPTLSPESTYCRAHSLLCHHPGPHLQAAARKVALSTPQAGALQLGKNAGCCAGWKAWESAALLFHVNIPPPLPFPRSLAENPFLFLSVQTRTMNSSSPQECDKVPTKPTRKVMYGL